MKESYGEDVAGHTGPESCGGGRKIAAEALTGESAGWVLSPERGSSRVPTPSRMAEGNIGQTVKARSGRTLRDLSPQARADASHTEAGRSPGRPRSTGDRIANPKGARR